jgi:threonine dehydrogenase-like Zn-dependent dehydrogenase
MNTSVITEQDKNVVQSRLMMKASVLYDVGRMEVRDVPRPAILPREVLVRVRAVGLCGTDAHIFSGHANYNTNERGRPIPLVLQPQILGHEIAGIIEEVGNLVSDLSVGDRVVVDQGINCVSRARETLCEYCNTNDSHQCEFYREHGITGLPGGLAEYIAIPAVNAVRINSALGFSEVAVVEPLGCIVHSSDRVANTPARYALNADSSERRVRSVLICGAGPAGLLFTEYLRQVLGYDGSLFVSDPNGRKRELAKEFGAGECIDPSTSDIVEAVHEYTGGKGVEYVIEASGAGEVLASVAQLIPKQATVLLYGHGHAGTDLSVVNNLFFKEPTLIASVGASGGFDSDGRPSVYRRALNLIEEKRISVNSLITHQYGSLEEVEGALGREIHDKNYVKGVVVL